MVDPAPNPTAETPAPVTTPETKPAATTQEEAAAKLMPKTPAPVEETKPAEKPPATETKPEAKKEETDKGAKAPVTYDLKLPEGSLLDKADLERITKTAKEHDFAPEDAQALLEAEHEAVKVYAEKQTAAMTEAAKTWKTESSADKEIGGEKFAENAELARRVVQKFGTPQLMKALTDSGLGNHPELVRIMVRIGRAIGDDQLVTGTTGPTPKAVSAADRLYPTTAKGEK